MKCLQINLTHLISQYQKLKQPQKKEVNYYSNQINSIVQECESWKAKYYLECQVQEDYKIELLQRYLIAQVELNRLHNRQPHNDEEMKVQIMINESLKCELQIMKNQIEDYKKNVQENESLIRNYLLQISQLKDNLYENKLIIDKQNQQLLESNFKDQQLEECREEIFQLKDQVQDEQVKANTYLVELKQQNDKIQQFEHEISKLKDQIYSQKLLLDKQSESLQKKDQIHDSQQKQFEKQLENERKNSNSQKIEIKRLQQEIEQLNGKQNRMDDLEEQLENERQNQNHQLIEINRLKREIEQGNRKFQEQLMRKEEELEGLVEKHDEEQKQHEGEIVRILNEMDRQQKEYEQEIINLKMKKQKKEDHRELYEEIERLNGLLQKKIEESSYSKLYVKNKSVENIHLREKIQSLEQQIEISRTETMSQMKMSILIILDYRVQIVMIGSKIQERRQSRK